MNPLLAPFLALSQDDPKRVLLVDGERAFTAAELREHAAALAADLGRSGVGPGDRVLLWLDNGAALALALLALQWRGAVGLALPPQARAPRLAALVQVLEARLLLTDAALQQGPTGRALQDVVPALRVATIDAESLRLGMLPTGEPGMPPGLSDTHPPDATPPFAGGDDDTLAMLAHTSGSSGEPKAVMLSRRNLAWAATTIAGYLGVGPGTRIGCALPLGFGYGQSHWWMALATGATLVLDRSFAFPAQLVERWAASGITLLPLVPSHVAPLLAQPRFTPQHLPLLRTVTTAAAALPIPLREALQARFPEAAIVPMYGQTECTRISFLPPDAAGAPADSVGRGLPGQTHWLRDGDGQRIQGPGVGELVVRGPHVMLGYWGDAEGTARKRDDADGVVDGERTLRTGDTFARDAEGWLRFLGRNDEIIKCGGEKVSPREIEDVLLALPGVAACAVRGVAHPVLGEAPQAWIVEAEGGAPDDRTLLREAARRLEPAALPKAIHRVEALPLSDRGKVLKRLLTPNGMPTPEPESPSPPTSL